jgi:hypothetical protein
MTAQRGPTPAPYFCLARAAWIAYAITWTPETGELRGVEGPRGFASYREAMGGEPVSDAHRAAARAMSFARCRCRCCRRLIGLRSPGPLCAWCAAGVCPRGRVYREPALDGRLTRALPARPP